jgi:hypothetical protein
LARRTAVFAGIILFILVLSGCSAPGALLQFETFGGLPADPGSARAAAPAALEPGLEIAPQEVLEAQPQEPSPAGYPAPPALGSAPERRTPTSAPIQTDPTPRPTALPPDVNPLTGLRVSQPELLERRPLGIKITIFPREARPQFGLSLADLVYEYYLEHGLTRFFAVFYGNDAATVGPVRSARFFDEHLVRMYQSVFVFANADRKVLDRLLNTTLVDYFVVERPDNCPPMCRNPWVQGYNNLYTDTRDLSEYILERGVDFTRPDLTGMQFDADLPAGGVPGSSLATTYSAYSYHLWELDPATGRYLRFQDAADNVAGDAEALAPLVDNLTGLQVAADNVVVLLVPHSYYSEQPEIVNINLLGTGPAYVFRDGRVFRVFWSRTRRAGVLRLTTQDGTPFPFKPGTTFFQVVGETTRVWQLGEDWRFDFQIP